MQKRTTNYSFQKFGDVFYSVNHNAGHLIDYVENDFKITNKSFYLLFQRSGIFGYQRWNYNACGE